MRDIKKYIPWSWKHPIKTMLQRHKFRKQRSERGYCDADIWDMDCWFLDVIPTMLRQLADDDLGFPEPTFSTHEEWKDWLISLAEQFESCATEAVEDQNPYDWEHNSDEYWKKREMLEFMAQKRLEDAFKEMAKHFHALWS